MTLNTYWVNKIRLQKACPFPSKGGCYRTGEGESPLIVLPRPVSSPLSTVLLLPLGGRLAGGRGPGRFLLWEGQLASDPLRFGQLDEVFWAQTSAASRKVTSQTHLFSVERQQNKTSEAALPVEVEVAVAFRRSGFVTQTPGTDVSSRGEDRSPQLSRGPRPLLNVSCRMEGLEHAVPGSAFSGSSGSELCCWDRALESGLLPRRG